MEIKFKYAAIRTDQFATFDYPNGITTDRCTVSGEVQTGNNFNARTIIITVISNIKFGESLVMTIKVSSYFEIEEESWNALKKDDCVVVPKEFLFHIGGLAVSTTRGILYAKTEGTDLNRFILPIIYMDQVIKGDMKIPIPMS
jgi:hypothetical protein